MIGGLLSVVGKVQSLCVSVSMMFREDANPLIDWVLYNTKSRCMRALRMTLI